MNIPQIIIYLKYIPFTYFLLSIMISLTSVFFSGLIYKKLLASVGKNISIRTSIALCYLGQLINYLAPFKIGVLFGKPLLTKKIVDIPIKTTLPIVFLENLIQITWQLIIFLVAIFILGKGLLTNNLLIKGVLLLLLLFIIFILIMFFPKILTFIWRLRKYPPKFIRVKFYKFKIYIQNITESFFLLKKTLINFNLISKILILSIPTIFIWPLFLILSTSLLNIKITYFTAFAIFWISYTIGRVSFLPMGLGVTDLTLGGLLAVYNIPLISIIEIIIFYRIFTIFPEVLIGGILSIYYSKKGFKNLFNKKTQLNS